MLGKERVFKFDNFVLNERERTLHRDGLPTPLTPKGFDLLLTFLVKPAQLLDKNQLLEAVWPDSFVEEGNLKFTVARLRRALSDDSRKPRYIETVSKQGYRFIAEVREIPAFEGTRAESRAESPTEAPRRWRQMTLAVVVLAIVATAVSGLLYVRAERSEGVGRLWANPFSVEKLAAGGSIKAAVVAADASSAVYLSELDGMNSVWLRRFADNVSVELIAPSKEAYGGLALSPDAAVVYFTRKSLSKDEGFSIYRLPIVGGIPARIASDAEGWISVSPNGEKISFVRCAHTNDDYCSLYIASTAKEADEQKLVTLPRPYRIGDNQFSPDGTSIAFGAGQSENGANDFGLYSVSIASHDVTPLTSERFFNVKSLAWLPGGNSLLVSALRAPDTSIGLWHVEVAKNEVSRLNRDSENYADISVDASANLMIATRATRGSRLAVDGFGSTEPSRVIANAMEAAYAPDGSIYFSSTMSGTVELWNTNPDGSEMRQLTNDPSNEGNPVVSHDGSRIYFSSDSGGQLHVWRMNHDGTGRAQLSHTVGGIPLFESADGAWIYYRSSINEDLWHVAADGTQELEVLKDVGFYAAYSPLTQSTAFFNGRPTGPITVVSTTEPGEPRSFELPTAKAMPRSLAWGRDGSNLLYVLSNPDGTHTLWNQSLDASKPVRIADLTEKVIHAVIFSPKDDQYAVISGAWQHDAVLVLGLR